LAISKKPLPRIGEEVVGFQATFARRPFSDQGADRTPASVMMVVVLAANE
jgi:hypothetical protein